MNVLTIANSIADQGHFPRIASLVGATGETERLILALMNEVGRKASEEHLWRVLWRYHPIELQAGVREYPVPKDLLGYHGNSVWDEANQWRLYGPLTPQEWQYIQSGTISSWPYKRFTIQGAGDGKFVLDPEPSVDEVGNFVTFGYRSTNWIRPPLWVGGAPVAAGSFVFYDGRWYQVQANGDLGMTPPTHTTGTEINGSVDLSYFDEPYDKVRSDHDVPLIAPRVLARGVYERLMEEKGLPFTPRFERELRVAVARERPAKTIRMGRPKLAHWPRIRDSGHGL